ncbi:PREDICTED: uncharacterized protein LOC106803891 [Ceratotherium simum simum]|uniref:Uncharacterized protein LOC106803891 n=1 Tax=Ceratotherium simum simum TaxID=73337 RepID=A0ABM1DKI3_CERSS|nr:PREDICTED: uncharacterized protein LOC106803891 [Ceratotherium simum simum]
MWVIDMVCLHNMNLVAIASTDQKIEFFDISNHKCVRAFTFIDLDSCVLVMDYWSDYHRGVFCYGDTKGNVIVFTSDNVTNGLFNPQILPRASKWGSYDAGEWGRDGPALRHSSLSLPPCSEPQGSLAPSEAQAAVHVRTQLRAACGRQR